MTNFKGEMLVRHAQTESEIPKGKKMVVIIGVALVDEDLQESVEYKIDGTMNEKGMDLLAIQSTKKPLNKFDGWAANDIFDEYNWSAGKPESSRLKSFMEPASKALKKITNSHFSPIPSEEIDEFVKKLTKQHKTLPVFDTMKEVFKSIIETLKDIKNKKAKE